MASRDFLGGFGREAGARDDKSGSGGAGDKPDEMELSLGLSLGGCFGTDPAREAKKQCLARSSSIASICTLPGIGGEDLAAAEPITPPLLHRTSSLPTEYDEARFQRKAMQCQRRLAAKRKRLERRNSMNSSRSSAGAARDDAQQEPSSGAFQLRRTSSNLPAEQAGSGSGSGGDAKSSSAMNTSSDNSSGQQNTNNSSSSSLPPTPSSGSARPPPPNGSTARGAEQQEQPPLRTLRSLTMRTASTGDFRKTMMEEMPMVFSRLDGPNARRIDGFLYKFGKANDVRIVCVCHGNFLTPKEFVRHAGGGGDDLEHPLRHIIINRQPSEFL